MLGDADTLAPVAADALAALSGACWERSLSGSGLHCIVRATLPGDRHENGRLHVEAYDTHHAFTITGDEWNGTGGTII